MRRFLPLIIAVFAILQMKAQTFTGVGGNIPDSGFTPNSFPIHVNGIGNINAQFGLTGVCINITHSWDSDLEIYLISPSGTMVPLSIQNGGSGQNYTNTCFAATAASIIGNASAPFTGSFTPDGYLGAFNNGQNANGNWNLFIKDIAFGETGSLLNWSITFGNNPPANPPACTVNPLPSNTCQGATPVCSFNGFCASTAATFTADTWPDLDNAFCGSVQNNAFVKFTATAAIMDFNVWVTSSTNHDGIQIMFFEGNYGGSINELGCYSPISPGASPFGITAAGLVPGNIYYMMIDGFAGDECDYIIQPFPAPGGLQITADNETVCEGTPVQLTASGGNGNYSWQGVGLTTTTGTNVTAYPQSTAIYSVTSVEPGGMCPTTKEIEINISRAPVAPTATDTLRYCQGSVALPLAANGQNLLWYFSSTGGSGSPEAIIPSTITAGIVNYYVSQTLDCESERTPIAVMINEKPFVGSDKQKTLCNGNSINLTGEFASAGYFAQWSFNNQWIPPPVHVSDPGMYQLEVKDNNGCADTARIQLSNNSIPRVFAGNDTISVAGKPIRLHCTPATNYSWLPENLLDNPHIQNPTAVVQQDQLFIVQVTDDAGCKSADSVFVKTIKGITYYVPTAFTPNGDGLNDIFRAVPVGIAHTEYFRVINRFGKVIFETNDPLLKGWDGTFMGYKQPSGTYIWLIKGIDINGKIVEMKGNFILIQ